MLRARRRGSIRTPEVARQVRIARAMPVVKVILIGAAIIGCVLLMIWFGFPLIEDLVTGKDPALRYQPAIKADFSAFEDTKNLGVADTAEMYLTDFPIKNDPYIDEERIIFSTRYHDKSVYELDAIVLYDIASESASILENVEKKYDNLLSPVLSGNYAVWLDSMTKGGGRIVGYDLASGRQFTIKDYGYALPKLSVSGDLLAFMQWAGAETQRLYVYNLKTREPVTVKLYTNNRYGNSAASISDRDLVWSEYGADGAGVLKRIVFSGNSAHYDNYDLGMNVCEPKTNGRDIVFTTDRITTSGALMLSTNGGEPVRIADHVSNYGIGDNFVAYTKEDRVYVCFTNEQNAFSLTSEIAKARLSCVNGTWLTYYDVTDGVVTDEVVMYADVK